EGVVLGAQVDLVVVVRARVAVLGEVVVAAKRLDLLHRDLQLVRDPCVGAPLPDPCPDLVEMWAQRAACHGRAAAWRTPPRARPSGARGETVPAQMFLSALHPGPGVALVGARPRR